jgi:hypothetical protein
MDLLTNPIPPTASAVSNGNPSPQLLAQSELLIPSLGGAADGSLASTNAGRTDLLMAAVSLAQAPEQGNGRGQKNGDGDGGGGGGGDGEDDWLIKL